MLPRFVRAALALSLVAISLASASAPATLAQTQVDFGELKAQLYRERWQAEPAPMHVAKPTPELAQGAAADALASDRRIVFQTFRDENWEIYAAQGDGTSLKRLTFDGASDVEPTLSANGNRVAFTSNRDGNWEIYLVNPDGTGLQRATVDLAHSLHPTLNANGTRVAFTSNLNGLYQIFVANADSSGLSKVSLLNSNEFDPAFSPDGAKLAWVREIDPANAIGALIAANADGNAAQGVGSPCAYMARPAWSPDMRQIAAECDIDGDFWTELVVFPSPFALNPATYVVYDAGTPLQDVQSPAWSPDGTALFFTRTIYRVENNQLRVDNYIAERIGVSGGPPSVMPFAVGVDTSVDARWIDNATPATAVVGSQYAGIARPLRVSWRASDGGPSGVLDYDVQVRYNDFAWDTRLERTTNTWLEIQVSGSSLQRITTRVRARDRAGNVEPWPESGPGIVTTLIFSSALSGSLTDNRGVPLASVPIVVPNNTPPSVATESGGAFFVPFTAISPPPLTATISWPGYAPIPGVSPAGPAIILYRPYLFGTDNAIANSHFSDNLAGWDSTNVQVESFFGSLNEPAARLASFNGAALTQTASLPANGHRLTLAFVYRTGFAQSALPLTAHVSDGIAETQVFTSPVPPGIGASGWQLASIDAQRWAGQTITISLRLVRANLSVVTDYFVDAVSLSSWHTPWAQQVSPSRADAGAQTQVTITGQNFIAPVQVRVGGRPLSNIQVIDEATITGALPPDLPLGRLDVSVSNAGGQEFVLPHALLIGREVLLPITPR